MVRAAEGQVYTPAAHSDGSKGEALTCVSRHIRDWQTRPQEEMYMQMDGRQVFQFAVKKVPEVIAEVLKKNDMAMEELDYFILHQANQRIVEAVARRMGVSMERFPMNLQEYGNTSSASIPILLDELRREQILKPGQKIVMAGFGAGLSWGASIVDWVI